MKRRTSQLWLSLVFLLALGGTASAPAAEVSAEWGGQVQARASLTRPGNATVYRLVGTDTAADGDGSLRLKNTTRIGYALELDAHYEARLSGGDTRRRRQRLLRLRPGLADLLPDGQDPDARRLFDFTRVVSDRAGHVLDHRLDRLSVAYRSSRGSLRLGRQALTWGNGMIFNPLDLFNPFAPTDVVRDYKTGADMAVAQAYLPGGGDLQLLYVPRRPAPGDAPHWDASSVAAKLHRFAGDLEFDLVAARHYRDTVLGGGLLGDLGDAAWRLDAVWTIPGGDLDARSFLSFVVNLDYSWTWRGRNWYGLVEYHHNDLGSTDYGRAIYEPRVRDRLLRGELFGLGRDYLALQLRWEVHPLVNLYLAPITNLAGPSGLVQPYLMWDVTGSLRATAGAVAHWGAAGTEYGGYRVAGTPFEAAPNDSAYLMLTWFF